ncbi:MAG: hypothetical protein H0U95_18440 [Bacteroidetes bacterium]|nr:hypothetical protein [Bacteroidota bacterium]
MKINFVLKQLEENFKTYVAFWTEWSRNEECSLNEDDLYILEVHQKNNFKLDLLDSLMFYNQVKYIERINAKLRWDCKKFKHWVILNFLFSIIELARNNGWQTYLHKPIGILDLSEDLKKCLFRLNIICMYQIFENYKEEDFEQEKIFNVIMEFENLNKNILPHINPVQPIKNKNQFYI